MEKHILLIGDDADEMDFFQLAQKEMPGLFKCSYTDNPVNASDTISRLKPDLVFLDINMPALNGLECLAEIKKTVPGKNVPIILYSTYIDVGICKKAMGLGAVDCIKKPIMISVFQKMLREVLAKL